jgi:hypothetical protein
MKVCGAGSSELNAKDITLGNKACGIHIKIMNGFFLQEIREIFA